MCQLNRRVSAVALTVMVWVLLLGPRAGVGQGFWEDAEKLPMAPTWLVEKAELPPYSPPMTPEGVPDLQGAWGGPGVTV